MSDEASEAVNENQNRLTESQEEQITKPPPKAKPQRQKDPKKVAAGKKLAEKNREAKEALAREIKREQEMAEKDHENDNSSPEWLPELSFPTVLSIAGIILTAVDLYWRFYRKDDSEPRGKEVEGRSRTLACGRDKVLNQERKAPEGVCERKAPVQEAGKEPGQSPKPKIGMV